MRIRLHWFFAGITALVVGYTVYRRQEAKRVADENRRYREREEKLKAIVEAMKKEEKEEEKEEDETILPPAS